VEGVDTAEFVLLVLVVAIASIHTYNSKTGNVYLFLKPYMLASPILKGIPFLGIEFLNLRNHLLPEDCVIEHSFEPRCKTRVGRYYRI